MRKRTENRVSEVTRNQTKKKEGVRERCHLVVKLVSSPSRWKGVCGVEWICRDPLRGVWAAGHLRGES